MFSTVRVTLLTNTQITNGGGNNGNFELWKMLSCPLYVPREEMRRSILKQPVKHNDCNINPARRTD